MGHLQYTAADILFQHRAGRLSGKVAVVDGPRRVTYAELLESALRHAALLKDAGVKKGDRVGIFLRRSVEAAVALFGAFFAGAVAVVIHDRLRAWQVRYIVEHSEASLLVTDSSQLLYVAEPVADDTKIINLDRATASRSIAARERTIGADLSLIIYTSGSTGLPKGVMLSQANVLSGTQIVADYLNLTEHDTIISLLPFSFDYGLNQLLTSLLVGGTLVIERSFFAPDICATLQRERVTGMAGVPTLWVHMCQERSPFLHTNLPALRYVTNSGGRLRESIVLRIRRSQPHVAVYLMYGLTEAFRSTYLPPEEVDRRPTSIGRAIPNTEILIVDDKGRPCPAGKTGELVHRGPTVAMGYWRDAESTARVFRAHPFASPSSAGETVVFSGDLVRSDHEGYLYHVGRRDQLIKVNGFRVSPDEIETSIASSGIVEHVVAFGIRGGVDDEIVVAIVPREPSAFREEPLRRHCKDQMPEYMQPRVFWCIDRIPLTSTGKPDRVAIKSVYRERHPSPRTVARAAGTA